MNVSSRDITTAWKVSVFGVFLVRMQGNIRTRKTPNTDTFDAVQKKLMHLKSDKTNWQCFNILTPEKTYGDIEEKENNWQLKYVQMKHQK